MTLASAGLHLDAAAVLLDEHVLGRACPRVLDLDGVDYGRGVRHVEEQLLPAVGRRDGDRGRELGKREGRRDGPDLACGEEDVLLHVVREARERDLERVVPRGYGERGDSGCVGRGDGG
jgi:hypothetical protein